MNDGHDDNHALSLSLPRGRTRRMRPWESSLLTKRVIGVLGLLLSTSQGLSIARNFRRVTLLTRRQHYAPSYHQQASTSEDLAVVDQCSSFHDAVGLYVHIPYCRRRCRYCDFAIVPIGPLAVTEQGTEEASDRATLGFLEMDASYRAAILKEISFIRDEFNNTTIPLRSIYFGGGTPSLAPVETLKAILSAVLDEDSPFALENDAEVSIEMDPGTFTLSKLQSLQRMGFNRVSLGVQSFDDNILESIGRCHRQNDIWESISLLQQVYANDVNYSIDLISGLPGVSLAKWAETLQIATNLVPTPKHVSLYDLQVESGTVFAKWYQEDDDSLRARDGIRGSVPVTVPRLPSPDDCAFAYKYASGYLRAKGYEHYEISSYAYKDGDHKEPSPYRSRHNQIYWEPGSQWFGK